MNPAAYYLSGVESYPDYVPTEIQIGGQIWDQKNLNTARYRDGAPIPTSGAWVAASIGLWRYYQNSQLNGTIYGRLYNWYAMVGIWNFASIGNPLLRKNIAPVGWRVATEGDWDQLASYVTTLSPTGDVGGKLKEIGTSHWFTPNTGATNITGFTGLPGGAKGADGAFANLTLAGNFWAYDSSQPKGRNLNYNSSSLTTPTVSSYQPGRSIRLIKEDIVISGFTTTAASNVAVQSATSGGSFSNLPLTPSISDKGICWGTGGFPNIVTDSFTSAGSGTTPNPYSINITGLTPGVTYNIRAYATLSDGSGTAYGNTVSFTTPDGYPTVTTDAISAITGSTATGGGNVTSDGGFALSTFGVVWSTATNPTIALPTKTVQTGTIGAFTSSITGLFPVTPYYVRAYATNSYGLTSYGSQVTFTTAAETVLLYGYSLRRVVPGYSGPVIQVRKGTSTTLLQDFYFNANGELDQAAILAFVGTSIGYVSRWYDQSGRGNTLGVTSPVPGREPRIVENSTVYTKNGKITLRFPGSFNRLLSAVFTPISENNLSIFTVISSNAAAISQFPLSIGNTYFPRPDSSGLDNARYAGANRIQLGATDANNKIYSSLTTPTGIRAWKNNVSLGAETSIASSSTATDIILGYQAIGSTFATFNGTLQEVLFYIGDLSPTGTTSRSSITANAISYYSII